MEKQSILICLEKLNAGGVETAVLSQTKAFIKQGHKVVVLAQDGIYKKKLEEMGATHICFEFPLENNYHLQKAEEIASIIKKEEITQVHIEQFPCILSAFPACQMTGTPFVAYLHMAPKVQEEIFEWFQTHFDIYQTAFPSFFKMAEKIVAITESNIEYHRKLFSVPIENYVVKHNSIDFEQYACQEVENQKLVFLLPARFSQEKMNSIQNGIDIFDAYRHKKHAILKIAGDGPQKEELVKYIKEKQIPDEQIELIGNRNDIPECMAKSDIVLGVDRVILEAIACKRLAIITGYDNYKGIVVPENMEDICKENFSGMNLKSVTLESLVDTLDKLSSQEIKEITEKCYQFAKEHLAIENNVYMIPERKKLSYETTKTLFEDIYRLEEQRQLAKREEEKLIEQIQRLQEENKNINLKWQDENRKIREELEAVYHSRRWKYSTKMIELFRK